MYIVSKKQLLFISSLDISQFSEFFFARRLGGKLQQNEQSLLLLIV